MWNSLNHRSGKVAYCRFASPGEYFTHATEGGVWQFRMPGTYAFKNVSVGDWLDRPQMDAVGFNAKLPLMQSAFPDWLNAHLLAANPHSLDIVTPEGEHFTLQPTTNNDFVNPNGSEYAGMTYRLNIPNKGGRTLDLNYGVTLFDTQEQWIYANTSGSASAGASGGTPLGLTAEKYDAGNYRASNFVYAQYGPHAGIGPTYDLGELGEGSSIEITSEGSTNNRGQTSSEFVGHLITLRIQETSAAQLLQNAQSNNLDQDLVIYTRYNETFQWQNGCIRPERTGLSWDDKNGVRWTELAFKGTTAYAQVDINTAPGGISKGIATFSMVGV